MNTQLSPPVNVNFTNVSLKEKFFSQEEIETIKAHENRENSKKVQPKDSCTTNLFFGFFFDGTKNNYEQAETARNHSNVARLYDCYPGLSVPGVLPNTADWVTDADQYTNFFKVYAPGVSSPFKEVGDKADWLDEPFGAAAGRMGERRILWSLVQAINNVHRYFLKVPLVPQPEMDAMFRDITLNKSTRRNMTGKLPPMTSSFGKKGVRSDRMARAVFERILGRLHKAIAQHWPDCHTGRPPKISPAVVKTIYISIFGFSRGATQARAFTNWLQSLCELDAQLSGKSGGMSLGGFPVQFDFLGLFDTVAAIGVGNTLGGSTGHGAWADSEDSLRVPATIPCLHLVAAHEIRRSFPVDSISVGGTLSSRHQEIVLPGAHSDIGCGYCPTEQGRGTDPNGDDMLSRIPLLMMYRTARLSGVPLKLELASTSAKSRFALTKKAIADFNAYIGTCQVKTGPLHLIMREQVRKCIEWRVWRRVSGAYPLQSSESFSRASNFDKNDLYSAALEFEDEIEKFTEWRREKGARTLFRTQHRGFNNDHESEWLEIATWWRGELSIAPCVVTFFDNYVHDSRAWFKLRPGNPDNEVKAHKELQGWQRRRELDEANVKLPTLAGKSDYKVASDRLSPEQRRAVDEYRKTKAIPRMPTTGREPWESSIAWLAGAGYLRFRKIYGGHDSVLLSAVDAPASDHHPDYIARA
ncbi:DUF2235 domain-containing protein [Massilia sp. CFBP9026]|uniref:T6SS phospholipase effector Tle1-like catalytic domain-containing protein n=1 Tax=Massilia sp. CFBP9026 TaxID=3096536 RepID=UPI002A6B295F|nr:DUF2235 domain-containing protein [Massilia sp. CFBP9026]MDY0961397.1 DUF2235 domain-containing protein [Massilia sp. CFBP9026]